MFKVNDHLVFKKSKRTKRCVENTLKTSSDYLKHLLTHHPGGRTLMALYKGYHCVTHPDWLWSVYMSDSALDTESHNNSHCWVGSSVDQWIQWIHKNMDLGTKMA